MWILCTTRGLEVSSVAVKFILKQHNFLVCISSAASNICSYCQRRKHFMRLWKKALSIPTNQYIAICIGEWNVTMGTYGYNYCHLLV